MAGRCPQFDHFVNVVLDEKLKQLLRTANFADALQWSSTFESVANSDEARLELGEMLLAVGASPEDAETWLDQAMALYALACDLGPSAHRRVGALHGLALSADLETHRRASLHQKERDDLRRLEVAALADLPTAWRGKVYRRTEVADTAHKREEDEAKERTR